MSNIKGGGRAALSESVESSLISLLISLRETEGERHNDNNNSSKIRQSEHERKREHKEFLKNLVERYERDHLSKSFNQKKDNLSVTSSKINQLEIATSIDDNDHTQKSKNNNNNQINSKSKVRVELIEAVYGSKKKKGVGKSDNTTSFKDGTKKVMVFSKGITIPEIMVHAKSKLRMKCKPVRIFIVEKKIQLNLTGDLSGVKDGTALYITSQETNISDGKNDGINTTITIMDEKTVTAGNEYDDITTAMLSDPLEPVKQAYAMQTNKMQRSRNMRKIPLEHPIFSDSFDKLENIPEERASLPAASCRNLILEHVQNNRVVVICGATGCGKSTQVPQFLLEGMKACGQEQHTNILVTQPRRVAAISLAQRVSYEMGSSSPGQPGSMVGYNVRLDRAVSTTAKIVYCTVGILLRMLVCPQENSEDSMLKGEAKDNNIPLAHLSHVVIDEVHERDMNTDFVLTLLRSLLKRNPHLRIILMSATASANLFVQYFATHLGKKPTVIDIPGRSFPVDDKWLEDCENFASSRIHGWSDTIDDKLLRGESSSSFSSLVLSPRATEKIDNNFIKELVITIVDDQKSRGQLLSTGGSRKAGAILVFLPGRGEIEALFRVLINDHMLGNREFFKILRLHSAIPRGEQQIVFKPAQEGTVKIVLATNIAETSITISDVSNVIDTGRVKESRFNPSTRIKELVTVWTSRASAKQRAGRAGRTSAGVCWKLFSEKFAEEYMPDQTSPEIVRTPLDELVLQVCLLYEQRRDEQANETLAKFPIGACPMRFLANTPEPPPEDSLRKACIHLLEVDALRIVKKHPVLYRLTPLGYHLSRLPMDAKVGKILIVGCMLECLNSALTIAATLSCTKSCFSNRWGKTDKMHDSKVEARSRLIESGFGGRDWKGGTVKGDLMAAVAVYKEWTIRSNDTERASFCRSYALDCIAMKEIHRLRNQFLDCLSDAGFLHLGLNHYNKSEDDALLTSCCLVAGLYPNICTLTRPRKGGFKDGRLLTKEGDVCLPGSSSFQRHRVAKTSITGKDAYAVYHAKHRSLGAGGQSGQVFLSEVNFISRHALILFGGELDVRRNAIIVDDWLKFKVTDKGITGAVLLLTLRSELDKCMLKHIVPSKNEGKHENERLIMIIRQLLAEE